MGVEVVIATHTTSCAGAALAGELYVKSFFFVESSVGVAFSDVTIVVDINEVEVAADGSNVSFVAAIKEVKFSLKVMQRRSGQGVVGIVAEDPLYAVRIGVIDGVGIFLVAELGGIEGLFVLSPADVADEGCIVVDDTLTANFC